MLIFGFLTRFIKGFWPFSSILGNFAQFGAFLNIFCVLIFQTRSFACAICKLFPSLGGVKVKVKGNFSAPVSTFKSNCLSISRV